MSIMDGIAADEEGLRHPFVHTPAPPAPPHRGRRQRSLGKERKVGISVVIRARILRGSPCLSGDMIPLQGLNLRPPSND